MASSDPAKKVSTGADHPAKKVSTGADHPAKKVSTGDDDVKAGYWFCTTEFPGQEKINLFTHLYAGFAKVQYPNSMANKDDVIIFPDQYGAILGEFPTDVKNANHSLKALLSIGGEGPDISRTIALVARDDNLRAAFIQKSITLARDHKYDGLDLCWLYPSADEMDLFALLLKDWRQAIEKDASIRKNQSRLLLTAAVFHHPVSPGTDVKYPFKAISDNLDKINVLAIDFYAPSNSPNRIGPVHAWLNISGDINRCGSAGIADWIDQGVMTHNLVLGLPFYGFEWTLKNHDDHGFFAPAHAAKANSLAFRKIQATYNNSDIDPVYNEDYVATYWYSEDNTWIGFDNAESISVKIRKARKDYNLGGYFAWHVGADDDGSTLSTAASDAWDI